jgi:hypothetical protein
MSDQTNLDLTDKQPTALMQLEAILIGCMSKENESFDIGWNAAIEMVIEEIEQLKPSELADLKQAFCDGYVQTESAETWSKKWGQVEPNQP